MTKEKIKSAAWPLTMCVASTANMIGAAVQVSIEYTSTGKIAPFPATAMATSALYSVSNGLQAYKQLTTKPVIGEQTRLINQRRNSLNDLEKGIKR